jgi:hypothetical protein
MNIRNRTIRFAIAVTATMTGQLILNGLLQVPTNIIASDARAAGLIFVSGGCDWEAQSWDGMSNQARLAWRMLGWSRGLWDSDRAPASSSKDWSELSASEKRAATWLGYEAQTWAIECPRVSSEPDTDTD